jgi:hypothetical protein
MNVFISDGHKGDGSPKYPGDKQDNTGSDMVLSTSGTKLDVKHGR